MEENMQGGRSLRATYLIGGAVLGAILGFLFKNIFIGSAIGIFAGVLLVTRKEGERQA
jgi:hypothetical protein